MRRAVADVQGTLKILHSTDLIRRCIPESKFALGLIGYTIPVGRLMTWGYSQAYGSYKGLAARAEASCNRNRLRSSEQGSGLLVAQSTRPDYTWFSGGLDAADLDARAVLVARIRVQHDERLEGDSE